MVPSIKELLTKVIKLGGSDMHIAVGLPPMVRVNGSLETLTGYDDLKSVDTQEIIYSVMNEEQISEFESERECDMSFGIDGLSRFRLNVYRDRGSVVAAFRAIPFEIKTTQELGLPKVVSDFAQRPTGLVLVCGPTGSGKSTTLYSIINQLNTDDKNVITVEDPVEYLIEGLTQIQVRSEIGLTFASGLRAILRQSPDIVMVGEIRDSETADIAIKASLTGQLVFSTLHTNDSAGALTRLVDMRVEPFLVASSLIMVCAQRLCRKICSYCKEQEEIPSKILAKLECAIDPKIVFYHGKGCERCQQTGYLGRVCVSETLEIDDEIREMIIEGKSSDEVKKYARECNNTTSLRMDINRKFTEGITTIEEVFRVTSEE